MLLPQGTGNLRHAFPLERHAEDAPDHGGGFCSSGASNELWSFGEEVYGILRRWLDIREEHTRYAFSISVPIMRMDNDRIRELSEYVRETKEEIAAAFR